MKSIYRTLSLLVCVAVFAFLLIRPGMEGDSQMLVDGSYKGLQCLRDGVWSHCPNVGQFTVFQYLPSWAMEVFGAQKGFVIHVLAYLSLLSGLLCFREMYFGLSSRGRAVQWTGLLILVGSYWMRYLNLSFAELLASFVTLGFVSSFLREKNFWITGLFLFAATLSKDTAFPFLLLLLISTCFFGSFSRRGKACLKLLPFMATGILCNFAFNFFRFGSILNYAYLSPEMIVHDPHYEISFFFGQWFSQSGGLWLFWPSFTLLMGSLFWILFQVKRLPRKIPALSVIAILLGLTVGFSKWYCPLGAYSWGARFFVPWGPALSFLVLWIYSDEIKILLAKICKTPLRFWIITGVLTVLAFPQFAFLFRMSLIGKVIEPDSCLGLTGLAFENCKEWQPWPWGIVSFYNLFPRIDLFLLAAFMSTWVTSICLKIRSQTLT
jgi:hypothetical protein